MEEDCRITSARINCQPTLFACGSHKYYKSLTNLETALLPHFPADNILLVSRGDATNIFAASSKKSDNSVSYFSFSCVKHHKKKLALFHFFFYYTLLLFL